MGDGNAPGAADSVEGDLERSSALSGSGMVIAGDQFVLFSGRVQHFQMEHLCTGGAGSFKGDFDLSAPGNGGRRLKPERCHLFLLDGVDP